MLVDKSKDGWMVGEGRVASWVAPKTLQVSGSGIVICIATESAQFRVTGITRCVLFACCGVVPPESRLLEIHTLLTDAYQPMFF